ncbi:MAG TPA: NAD(P)/FAD-dependent oxidoreductase [Blastocatellia bacterium]|nr:NAD(P)/FAD-dependent oxidoreductase [Blastocatellia bacterium]
MSGEILDVAIVGGGVSGVYSAWRLLTEGKRARVEVFEAGNHIGGRLLSVTPPGISNMTAELGGMRILPAVQPRITKLIQVLNREASPNERIDTYPFPVDQPANISYLRGIHLRLRDFQSNPSEVPYHLTFLEFGNTPGQLVVNAINQLVPGITDPKLSEEQRKKMAQEASFDGKPLYQQGFWNVLMRVMSGEAYQLGLAAGGYETTLTNWNAADAIPWYLSDFGVDPKYEGFRKGFQQVPLTLEDRVKKVHGLVHCNRRVLGFDRTGDGIELRLADGNVVQTKSLILAMPRRALDLITGASPILQDQSVRRLIESVTPRPLFKLFTTYDSPWWLPAGVEKGRTTTDLPVRQTYYWPKDDGQPATQGRAMLMASYDDGTNIGFWDGFRAKRGIGWRGGLENVKEPDWFLGAADKSGASHEGWLEHHAPARMVDEVQRQLAVIHGLQFTPGVVDACFKDWGDDPFGGGWNSWNIGAKSWEVKEQIINPAPDVYICGEAYSDAQGWVEGAIETADLMLKKFGICPLS